MNVKPKKCKICSTEFKPHKSTDRFCSLECFKKQKKSEPKKRFDKIPNVSKKRKIENLQYQVLRAEFLNKTENKICPITGQQAIEVHHKYSGKDRSKYFLDVSTWLAVSRQGHNWIHENPKEARGLGYLY